MNALLIRSIVVLALVGATGALCVTTPNINVPSAAGLKMDLPKDIESFVGEDMEVSPSELKLLPKDTEFAKKLYKDPNGDQINCQIVLSGGEKRSIHRPEICLPAQGWNKKSGEVMKIPLDNGQTLSVMKLVISKPIEVQPGVRKELTSLFLYWFVGKDITTPYHWYRILHTDWDRVVNNVNHRWAYVIVSAPVLDGFAMNGKNQEQTLEMLKKFVGEIAPRILNKDVKAKDS